MPSRITVAIVAVAVLASVPAFGATHDDTTYPETPARWTGVHASVDEAETYGDVAYPGAHMTIAKQAPPPAPAGFVAVLDDTTYPSENRAPAPPGDLDMPALERLACGCGRR